MPLRFVPAARPSRTMTRPRYRLATVLLLALAAACVGTPPPSVSRGQQLFDTCSHCHGQDGGGNQELGAPAIAGLPKWYIEAQLSNFMAAHRGYAPFDTTGIRMKSMAWTLDMVGDTESVADYVSSLPPTNPAPVLRGNAASGAGTFQVCMACHGPQAKGNADVHAPPLAMQSDWYLLTQLHKFKAGWRGTNADDIWGQTMRAQALVLDDTTMANVVAYIQTLR